MPEPSGGGAPDQAILTAFGVDGPEAVAKTPIAEIWRVSRADGTPAALKLYRDEGLSNEGPGLDYLAALDGEGTVRILDRRGRAVLLEWLEGPSLGDMVRGGEDVRAAHLLVEVANRLHARPVAFAGLAELPRWFGALTGLRLAPDCPARAARDLGFCRDLAGRLLADQRDIRALHGDLHHDNIRFGSRGATAFDAKGVRGERAFELANAFRNPKGVEALVRSPDRARFLRDLWSEAFAVPPGRLMAWAAVKTALSICWRAGGPVAQDAEFDLLAMFVDLLDETVG